MKIEQPVTVPIKDFVDEAEGIRTFFFDYNINSKPGQFFLLWIPGLNEKPFGVASEHNKGFSTTISNVGPFTETLFEMKKGSLVGIRGPYGTGFNTDEKLKNVILIGGGYGSAPLSFLADKLASQGAKVDFIIGAKTAKKLVYRKRKFHSNITIHYCTDDGTLGVKCFSTDLFEKLATGKAYDFAYACGPERMMKKVVEICDKENINCEISLERYIKCGIGVCGQCCVDDLGIRMCVEGPVINKELAKKISEFGKYKRDASGIKVRLN
jgi:dihydroorotate dehydrogenase electron transfer subunit